jgi:hypothetical protein
MDLGTLEQFLEGYEAVHNMANRALGLNKPLPPRERLIKEYYRCKNLTYEEFIKTL